MLLKGRKMKAFGVLNASLGTSLAGDGAKGAYLRRLNAVDNAWATNRNNSLKARHTAQHGGGPCQTTTPHRPADPQGPPEPHLTWPVRMWRMLSGPPLSRVSRCRPNSSTTSIPLPMASGGRTMRPVLRGRHTSCRGGRLVIEAPGTSQSEAATGPQEQAHVLRRHKAVGS